MLIIVGKSGSGKSSVKNELIKLGFYDIKKYTTRKPRDNESEISDYIFVTDDYLEKACDNNTLILKETFNMADGNTVKYAYYEYDLMRNTDNKVVIMTPQSLKEFTNTKVLNEDQFVIYYLNCQDYIRIARSINRGDDYAETTRRLKADDEDFKDLPISKYTRYINTEEMTPKLIASYIAANYKKTLKEIEDNDN